MSPEKLERQKHPNMAHIHQMSELLRRAGVPIDAPINGGPSVGFLVSHPIRSAWPLEVTHFTPWLAKPENLAHLGRVLGIGVLELEACNFSVGAFSADIVARDGLGNRVIIENQIETSDHTHLGQCVTYLAGTENGLTVVWIAPMFRSEHQTALKWLNDRTSTSVRFFGVEILAWRIGNSEPAAQFNVVVRPDDLPAANARAARTQSVGPDQVVQRAFWAAFQDFLNSHDAQHWSRTDIPIGSMWGRNLGLRGVNLYAITRRKAGALGVVLEIENQPRLVDDLVAQRTDIERDAGLNLFWKSPGTRYQIGFEEAGFDLSSESQWPSQHAWLLQHLEIMLRVFKLRIADFNPSDIETNNDETQELSVSTSV